MTAFEGIGTRKTSPIVTCYISAFNGLVATWKVSGKKKLRSRNASLGFETMPKRVPRIIWMYWDKPLEQALAIVRYSVKSWIEPVLGRASAQRR
ncbi:hypothetical protein [Ensifer canadensis]